MFFLFTDLKTTCRNCTEWDRHTYDNDDLDIGLCERFNRLTLESYDCSIVYEFLKEVGFYHIANCEACEFRDEDKDGEICRAKQRLKQGGWRTLDEESCPIRLIYKYIKQEERQ